MSDGYFPPSDFLQACADGDVTLSGSRFADANLVRLIAMTADADVENRDWATMLLAETELDTPDIRAAFLARLADEDSIVRGEALVGLAARDPAGALPHVIAEVDRRPVGYPTMRAAEAIGDPVLLPHLIPLLKERATPADDFDEALEDAIRACGGDPDAHPERSSDRKGPGAEGDNPKAQFLCNVRHHDVEFENHPRANKNLNKLLGYAADPDPRERDWAIFLIDRLPLDTPEIRAVLLKAADDEDFGTRDQALIGLARRDRAVALERVARLLEEESSARLMMAAAILADRTLLPLLRAIEAWDDEDIESREGDQAVELKWLQKAIVSCETGTWTYMGTA